MATDKRSDYAGSHPGLKNVTKTCILNEGAPTVTDRTYGADGLWEKTLVWASELYPGDYVAICNTTDVTFEACGGVPVVEKAVNAETLVVGKIVSLPRPNMFFPAASADANDLSERLAGKYYRVANVEIMAGITKLEEAVVMCDGATATMPGDGQYLKFNITSSYANHGLYFDSISGGGGVGVIPFHYVPAGTDGDLYSCLVGITGLMPSVTGA